MLMSILLNSEIDNLVRDNTAEMEPGVKFRCKLCGKLFKGQEFVRKHINLKHNDKLEEVRNDVSNLFIASFRFSHSMF